MVEVGTVIHGTHLIEDILPALLNVLKQELNKVQFRTITRQIKRARKEGLLEELVWEDLFNAMKTIAPKGYYFGATEGDGSDFGFWEICPEDDFEE